MRLKAKEWYLRSGQMHVLMASFLLGITAAFFLGVDQSLKQSEDTVRPHLQVSVFLLPSVSDADAAQFGATLKSHDSEIVSSLFISKATAFQEAQKDPALAKSLMMLNDNPLPAVYNLQYSDRAWMTRLEPGELLKGLPLIQEIRWDAQSRSIFLSLHQGRAWLNRLCLFTSIALGMWALFGTSRLIVLKASFLSIVRALAVGACGGVLAAGLWWFASRTLSGDTLFFHVQPLSPWPVLTGLLVGLALVTENSRHENK